MTAANNEKVEQGTRQPLQANQQQRRRKPNSAFQVTNKKPRTGNDLNGQHGKENIEPVRMGTNSDNNENPSDACVEKPSPGPPTTETRQDSLDSLPDDLVRNDDDSSDQSENCTDETEVAQVAVGTVVNGYRFEAEIGSGTFAAVHRCRRVSDGKVFAIKIQANEVKKRVNLKARHEEGIMRRLGKHPNLVSMETAFTRNYQHYLVVELVTGGELFDKIVKQSPFSEGMARNYVRDMLEALRYMHSKRVVHRDVKPENLLLTSDGRVKLADFGESTVLKRKGYCEGIVGSKCYIAPEILHGNNPRYNEKVDCWSAGVVAYTMLSGETPFHTPSDSEIGTLRKIRHGVFSFNSPVWSKVSDSAKNFLRCMICKDITQRLSSSQALAHPWLNGDHQTPITGEPDISKPIREGLPKLKRQQQLWRRVDGAMAAALIHRDRAIWMQKLQHKVASIASQSDTSMREAQRLDVPLVNDSTMSEREWNAWVARCKSLFRVCDIDCSGTLSEDEVLTVSEMFHLGWTKEMVSSLFENIEGRQIDFNQFVTLLRNVDSGSFSGAVTKPAARRSDELQRNSSNDSLLRLQMQQANLQVALMMLFPQHNNPTDVPTKDELPSIGNQSLGGNNASWKSELGHTGAEVSETGDTRGSIQLKPSPARSKQRASTFSGSDSIRISMNESGDAPLMVSRSELIVLLRQLLPAEDHSLLEPLLDHLLHQTSDSVEAKDEYIDIAQFIQTLVTRGTSTPAEHVKSFGSDTSHSDIIRQLSSTNDSNVFGKRIVTLSVQQLEEFWDELSREYNKSANGSTGNNQQVTEKDATNRQVTEKDAKKQQVTEKDATNQQITGKDAKKQQMATEKERIPLTTRITPEQFENAARVTLGDAIASRAKQLSNFLLQDLVCTGPWTLPNVQSILFYLVQFVQPSMDLVRFCFLVADTNESGYLDLAEYSSFVTSMIFDASRGRALALKSSPLLLREMLMRLFEAASRCNNRITLSDFIEVLRSNQDDLAQVLFGVSTAELLQEPPK